MASSRKLKRHQTKKLRKQKLLEKNILKQMIMAQMNLTPLDDVLDKHFGKLALQNVTLLKVM